MRTYTLMLICGGLILATVSIGVHSDVGTPMEIDRTHKGDRLPLTEVNVTRPPALGQRAASAYDLPDGCDALDDRFHETDQLPALDFSLKNAALSKAAYDSNLGSARLVSPLTHSQLARMAGRCMS
jgi:hypothetical protein